MRAGWYEIYDKSIGSPLL